MEKSFTELIIGNLDEKRAWRQMMKRVNALPEDYRFAYKKIQSFGYNFGFCCLTESNLLELFEENAAAGRPVLEVVGSDAAAFCEELISASKGSVFEARETLNREIAEYFSREEK